jgi:hypothetical protein
MFLSKNNVLIVYTYFMQQPDDNTNSEVTPLVNSNSNGSNGSNEIDMKSYTPYWHILVSQSDVMKILQNDKSKVEISKQDEDAYIKEDIRTLNKMTDEFNKSTPEDQNSFENTFVISAKTFQTVEKNPNLITQYNSGSTDEYSEQTEKKDEAIEDSVVSSVEKGIEEDVKKEVEVGTPEEEVRVTEAMENTPLLESDKKAFADEIMEVYRLSKRILKKEKDSKSTIEKITKFDYYSNLFDDANLQEYFNFLLDDGTKCFIFYKSGLTSKQYYLLSNTQFTYNGIPSTSLFSIGFIGKTILDNKNKINNKDGEPLAGNNLIVDTILRYDSLLRGDKKTYDTVIKGNVDTQILSKYVYDCFDQTIVSLGILGTRFASDIAKIKDLFSYLVIKKLFYRGFNKKPFVGKLNTRYSMSNAVRQTFGISNIDTQSKEDDEKAVQEYENELTSIEKAKQQRIKLEKQLEESRQLEKEKKRKEDELNIKVKEEIAQYDTEIREKLKIQEEQRKIKEEQREKETREQLEKERINKEEIDRQLSECAKNIVTFISGDDKIQVDNLINILRGNTLMQYGGDDDYSHKSKGKYGILKNIVKSTFNDDNSAGIFSIPLVLTTEILYFGNKGIMTNAVYGGINNKTNPLMLFKEPIKKVRNMLINIEQGNYQHAFFSREYYVVYPALVIGIFLMQIIKFLDLAQFVTFFGDMRGIKSYSNNSFELVPKFILYVICRLTLRPAMVYIYGIGQILGEFTILSKKLTIYLFNSIANIHDNRQEHFNDVYTLIKGGGRGIRAMRKINHVDTLFHGDEHRKKRSKTRKYRRNIKKKRTR